STRICLPPLPNRKGQIMNRRTGLTSLLIAFLVSAFPVAAATPDGLTPAEETVCDPLMAEGVTKGLYGLCIAFCEAQDVAARTSPLTPEDLDAIKITAPSGHILANYNKKKQVGDPEMPCILVQEACPCFTEQELQEIDGYDADGLFMDNFTYDAFDFWGRYFFGNMTESNVGTPNNMIQVDMWTSAHSGAYCSYKNNQATPAMTRVLYSKNNPDFTEADWQTCYEMLVEAVSSQ
ncbi:MAG: hypothetical protein RQ723_04700, partial [Desulfuromonadales bacterium]|nr:hypothetical protein [Desulfuromonadales bacterium]